MFESIETQLQTELPHFSAKHILNAQINGLLPYFEQHIAQIESLTTSLEEQFVIAGRTFKLVASPVIVEAQRVRTVFEWQDRTEELAAAEEKARIASENARVKYALDGSSGQVMIADKDLNVIYMNNAIHDMFQVASQDMSKPFHILIKKPLLVIELMRFLSISAIKSKNSKPKQQVLTLSLLFLVELSQ